jgi:hypothetical protein
MGSADVLKKIKGRLRVCPLEEALSSLSQFPPSLSPRQSPMGISFRRSESLGKRSRAIAAHHCQLRDRTSGVWARATARSPLFYFSNIEFNWTSEPDCTVIFLRLLLVARHLYRQSMFPGYCAWARSQSPKENACTPVHTINQMT